VKKFVFLVKNSFVFCAIKLSLNRGKTAMETEDQKAKEPARPTTEVLEVSIIQWFI